jgi:LmbE family N-acetylglucosaminyl deacetylase
VVFSGGGSHRAEEARRAASALVTGNLEIEIHDFEDGYLPYEGRAVKDLFESIKRRIDPDVVFTHRLEDRHQDHRLVSELTWNTFRDHLILEYEIPKYEGDLGEVNCYVPVEPALVQRKIDVLLTSFESQRDRRWFTDSTFRGLMRLRGVESNVEYAEAFYGRKFVLQI